MFVSNYVKPGNLVYFLIAVADNITKLESRAYITSKIEYNVKSQKH